MSKMKKVMMVVMIVLVSCLLIAMTFEVKATDGGNPIDISGNLDLTVDDPNGTTEPDLNSESQNTELNTQVIQPDTNVENTLPQTGVTEDITVMFFIVVCAISAIYAYKKIRDYNV